jgi:hypothetical protein
MTNEGERLRDFEGKLSDIRCGYVSCFDCPNQPEPVCSKQPACIACKKQSRHGSIVKESIKDSVF